MILWSPSTKKCSYGQLDTLYTVPADICCVDQANGARADTSFHLVKKKWLTFTSENISHPPRHARLGLTRFLFYCQNEPSGNLHITSAVSLMIHSLYILKSQELPDSLLYNLWHFVHFLLHSQSPRQLWPLNRGLWSAGGRRRRCCGGSRRLTWLTWPLAQHPLSTFTTGWCRGGMWAWPASPPPGALNAGQALSGANIRPVVQFRSNRSTEKTLARSVS